MSLPMMTRVRVSVRARASLLHGSERERELTDKEVTLGACEVALSETRRALASAEERLQTTQQMYEALDVEKQSLVRGH